MTSSRHVPARDRYTNAREGAAGTGATRNREVRSGFPFDRARRGRASLPMVIVQSRCRSHLRDACAHSGFQAALFDVLRRNSKSNAYARVAHKCNNYWNMRLLSVQSSEARRKSKVYHGRHSDKSTAAGCTCVSSKRASIGKKHHLAV